MWNQKIKSEQHLDLNSRLAPRQDIARLELLNLATIETLKPAPLERLEPWNLSTIQSWKAGKDLQKLAPCNLVKMQRWNRRKFELDRRTVKPRRRFQLGPCTLGPCAPSVLVHLCSGGAVQRILPGVDPVLVASQLLSWKENGIIWAGNVGIEKGSCLTKLHMVSTALGCSFAFSSAKKSGMEARTLKRDTKPKFLQTIPSQCVPKCKRNQWIESPIL